jgi:RNA polymerase sigma factor (sigma-70 family)
MTDASQLVLVVDDDRSMREALQRLLESVGHTVRCFASPSEFLQWQRPEVPVCIVLDVRFPGQSGLEFQRELQARGIAIPIVFLSGHADISMSVRAMKGGAIDFLTKPFREQDLLDAVDEGLRKDTNQRDATIRKADLVARLATLSPREREIMTRVVAGHPNKAIADALGVSEITIKVRRSSAMRKLGADSLAQLVRLAIELGFS